MSTGEPIFAVPAADLVPVSDHLAGMAPIPASRMFLINKALKVFLERYPGRQAYDASQGDGGASLPGVAPEILERVAQTQASQSTA
jgi:hypothetical protein